MNIDLTISIDENIYRGLFAAIEEKEISHFIENLVKPHVLPSSLESAYQEMASDKARENQAQEWSEGTLGDIT